MRRQVIRGFITLLMVVGLLALMLTKNPLFLINEDNIVRASIYTDVIVKPGETIVESVEYELSEDEWRSLYRDLKYTLPYFGRVNEFGYRNGYVTFFLEDTELTMRPTGKTISISGHKHGTINNGNRLLMFINDKID